VSSARCALPWERRHYAILHCGQLCPAGAAAVPKPDHRSGLMREITLGANEPIRFQNAEFLDWRAVAKRFFREPVAACKSSIEPRAAGQANRSNGLVYRLEFFHR